MKRVTASLAAMFLVLACSQTAAEPEPKTEEEKTFYALGLNIGSNLSMMRLTEQELEFVKAGLTDAILKRPNKVDSATYQPKVQELAQTRRQAAAGETRKAGQAFIDKAVAEGAVKTDSGMAIKILVPGDGQGPGPTDMAEVHYTGKLIDGTVFDSSVERGQPQQFRLDAVVPCWTEGVQRLKPGAKAVLYCPADLAYGDRGRPKIPPGSTLVFDVELLRVNPPPAPPADGKAQPHP